MTTTAMDRVITPKDSRVSETLPFLFDMLDLVDMLGNVPNDYIRAMCFRPGDVVHYGVFASQNPFFRGRYSAENADITLCGVSSYYGPVKDTVTCMQCIVELQRFEAWEPPIC